MSDMKRLNGSVKKPYAWNDGRTASVRAAAPARKSAVNAKNAVKPRKKNYAAIWLPKIIVAELIVAALVLTIVAINSSAQKSKLEAMSRRGQELSENVEATARTLEMETRAEVICQLAEERLYMVRPSESIALSTGADTVTAGR